MIRRVIRRAAENFACGDRSGVGWLRVGVENYRSF
jgi:hypothetical protein